LEQIDFNNTLIRCGFLILLDREFGIQIKDTEFEKMECARQCIEIYHDIEEFFRATQWKKDNPEFSDISYLESNRIIRNINGKVWYFSRVRWEELKKRGDNMK